MLRRFAQAVRDHVSHHSRWRHAGVHGAVVAGAVWVYWWWPVDPEWFRAFVDHPELYDFERGILQTALAFAALLGLIGLLRQSWIDRIAGVFALYRVQLDSGWYFGYEEGFLAGLREILFDAVVVAPFEFALRVGQDLQGVATLVVALYFGMIWLVTRFVARRAQSPVRRTLHHLRARLLGEAALA